MLGTMEADEAWLAVTVIRDLTETTNY